MKTIFFLIALVVLGPTATPAQDRDQEQDQDQVRLMQVDGGVLQIRDHDQIRLQTNLTLNDGTQINPDGSYTTRDRDRLRLKEGECMDMDGVVYNSEYQYRFKIKQENKGLSQAQIQERNQNRTHFILMDGQVFQVRNQSQNQLQQKLNIGNGVTVNPNGTYQTRDRKQLQLLDGECLNMDGKLFKNAKVHRKMMIKKNKMNKTVQKKANIQKKGNKKAIQ